MTLCLLCLFNCSNISTGCFALSVLKWRIERHVSSDGSDKLPTPDCPLQQWKEQPSDSSLRWRIFMIPGLVLPCWCWYWISIDLTWRRAKLTTMTVRSTRQILYPQNHCLHQCRRGRYYIIWLLGSCCLILHCWRIFRKKKKVKGREQGCLNRLEMLAYAEFACWANALQNASALGSS